MRPTPDQLDAARMRARARADRAAGTWPYPSVRQHPVFSQTMDSVLCRGCGAVLRGWVDDERFEEAREVNGQHLVYRRLIFATFSGYAELTMVFDDGSAHVAHGCHECLSKVVDLEDLEQLYAADLREWLAQESAGKGPARWDLLADRAPTKIASLIRGGTT